MHEARAGLHEAIRSSDATESSVRAASAQVATVEADLAVERLKLFREISPVLTEQQRKKVEAFQERLDAAIQEHLQRLEHR